MRPEQVVSRGIRSASRQYSRVALSTTRCAGDVPRSILCAASLWTDTTSRPVSLSSTKWIRLGVRSLSSSNNTSSSHDHDMASEALRQAILQAALQEVHSHGWTQEALVEAVQKYQQEQLQGSSSLAIAGMVTPGDLIAYAMDEWNQKLEQDLKTQPWRKESGSNQLRDRIFDALKLRLEYLEPFLRSQRWHEGMVLGARPENAGRTKRQLQAMIRTIADAVVQVEEEDSKHESSHDDQQEALQLAELEQLGLGAIYLVTELHMLSDTSTDFADSWDFLWQRVVQWDRLRQDPTSMVTMAPESFHVVTTVAGSLASGIASLLYPHPHAWRNLETTVQAASAAMKDTTSKLAESLPKTKVSSEAAWNALLRIQPFSSSNTSNQRDGTHPSHYDASNYGHQPKTN